ncbi:MAG TPA: single-stranded DNA-binding protein [Acidobacteriota bacterium]|nr:single-stranded DNA-binding protein [Acidobacteriota bacterium]
MIHPLLAIADGLTRQLDGMRFGLPVSCVYNPLEYARPAYAAYVDRYGSADKEFLLLGMNPGPWGMVQTGIPFGEVSVVRDWLGIESVVGQPAQHHPRRPVLGFACRRSEVSGRRLWKWIQGRWTTPAAFFRHGFVANYCPLAFFGVTGANLTPDKLPVGDRAPLLSACDEALRATVAWLRPRWVIGIGRFAAHRSAAALTGFSIRLGCLPHPSPASPLANRGWETVADSTWSALGVSCSS